MKLRTATLLAGALLLCLQHLTSAQSRQNPALPDLAGAFTRQPPAPPGAVRFVPGQAHRIESALDQELLALGDVVCHEQIARYARKGKITSRLDTLDTNVSVMNGVEKYSGVRQRGKLFRDLHGRPARSSPSSASPVTPLARAPFRSGRTSPPIWAAPF
jgi:hypothetical protein